MPPLTLRGHRERLQAASNRGDPNGDGRLAHCGTRDRRGDRSRPTKSRIDSSNSTIVSLLGQTCRDGSPIRDGFRSWDQQTMRDELTLWVLYKRGHAASAVTRFVPGAGRELRFLWDGDLRLSQVHRGARRLEAAGREGKPLDVDRERPRGRGSHQDRRGDRRRLAVQVERRGSRAWSIATSTSC